MNCSTILWIVLGILLIWVIWKSLSGGSEFFGQDASIRASSGWLAGPKGLYGYDPIDHFAEQIEEMKRREAIQVSSPDSDIGPENYQRVERPILGRNCRHRADCMEGEKCYVGTCIPAHYETYENDTEINKEMKEEFSMPQCGACS